MHGAGCTTACKSLGYFSTQVRCFHFYSSAIPSYLLLYRNRKVVTKERQWEPSFNKPEQSVLVWPEQFSEPVNIVTTLYKSPNDDHFDDKVGVCVFG